MEERRTLLGYPSSQRECVPDVVAGLHDAAVRRTVVPFSDDLLCRGRGPR